MAAVSSMSEANDSGRRILGSGSAAMEASMQGFGCMGITAFYGKPMEDDDAIALIKHASEIYVCKNEEDGSTIYNETIVGKALTAINQRDNIQIATKYFPKYHGETMTPELVIEACRASCERLQVEYLDLYYIHRIHPTVSIEEQAHAMLACQKIGLTKYIGLSEFSPSNIKLFHSICPITCIQQEWSLMNRDLEDELVPLCLELGIGIIAYSPLCRSLLSGEIKSSLDLGDLKHDLRPLRYPRFAPENIDKNIELIQNVVNIASDHNITPSQLSLAWVSNQNNHVVPIPGTTKIKHLNENLESRKVKLSKQELDMIGNVIDLKKVSGNRYTGGETAHTFKDQMVEGGGGGGMDALPGIL